MYTKSFHCIAIPITVLLIGTGLLAGCNQRDDKQLVLGVPGQRAPGVTKSACVHSGAAGDSSYCSAECPCDEGEGDCDSDDECTAGLTCRDNVGAHFGWSSGVDVCLSVCSPLGVAVGDACSAECPCEAGEGDCDSDDQCTTGLWCLYDAGTSYGYSDPDTDVCVSGCPTLGNGANNFCSSTCPCEAGEGDCDSDADCSPGTMCVKNVGASHGFDADVDICESSVCTDDEFEANDTAVTATQLSFDSVYWSGTYGGASVYMTPAQLCSDNEDWYMVPSTTLPFPVGDLDIHLRARNSGWCGVWCGDVVLADAPENTITLEFYDITGTTYLGGSTSTKGMIKYHRSIDLSGFASDFLMRISGPAAAQYNYEFNVRIQNESGEDECEC